MKTFAQAFRSSSFGCWVCFGTWLSLPDGVPARLGDPRKHRYDDEQLPCVVFALFPIHAAEVPARGAAQSSTLRKNSESNGFALRIAGSGFLRGAPTSSYGEVCRDVASMRLKQQQDMGLPREMRWWVGIGRQFKHSDP